MPIPSDYEITAWRSRWNQELADRVAGILRGTEKPSGAKEAARRIDSVNQLLSVTTSLNGIGFTVNYGLGLNFQLRENPREFAIAPILDLRGIPWRNKDYSRYNLDGITVPYAHMEGALLEFANLETANLEGAFLTKADFQASVIKHSNLSKSKLEYALFKWAHLEDVDLSGEETKLRGVDFDRATLVRVNFTDANLESACLQEVNCEGSNFERAHLEGANMKWANLKSTRFYESHLEGVDLFAADIAGASFDYAEIGQCGECKEAQKTRFAPTKFMPSLRDCLGLCSWGHRDRFWNEVRKARPQWKIIYALFWKRWTYTSFEGVEIESANTILAADLRRYVEDQRFVERIRETSPIAYRIWNLTTACGWSTMRLMFWAILVIILFASLYANFNLVSPPDIVNQVAIAPSLPTIGVDSLLKPIASAKAPSVSPAFQWFYVSFDIFTNLGIRVTTKPASNWGVAVMFFETILGWMTLGLAITVFANKYARRS